MAAAATAATRSRQKQKRSVALCRLLLLVAVILIIGDAVADAARAGSPRTDDDEAVAFQAGHLQGFRRWGEAPRTAAAGGGWSSELNKEQENAAGGGRRRMLVGSRAPTCTYNECRGCRHRCSVQEVPIDASDPINSAYHYKCICHL